MSVVLSVYSQRAFREIVLPERGQEETHILILKDLFGLDRDISLWMAYKDGIWRMRSEDAVLVPREGQKTGKPGESLPIMDRTELFAETSAGSRISILAGMNEEPFSAYQKYALSGVQEIRIGKQQGLEISYRGNEYVSGSHCTIQIRDGRAMLRDTSTNGTYVNQVRVYGSTYLNYGDSIRIMRLHLIWLGNILAVNHCEGLEIRLRQLSEREIERFAALPNAQGSKKILFHRSPRNLKKLNTEPFEIEAPPNLSERQEQPLALLIGPALTMAIPMLLGSGISVWASRQSGGTMGAFAYMGIVTAVSSALIGAFWALTNVRHARKTEKQQENRRFESYSEYLIRMRDMIQKAYMENAEALRERYLPAEQCAALDENSPLLWNRNVFHEDFLSVRLGIGDLPFQAPIQIPKERFTMMVDSLADKPRLIQDNYRVLKDVPVTVNLLENRLIGIVGGTNREYANAIARAVIAQIASSNCYTDVKIGIVYDEAPDIDRDIWNFALWLPHVWSGDKKIRYIATNRAEMGDVFHALAQVFRNRSEEEERNLDLKPRYILFVTDPRLLDGEVISHYVFNREKDLGLTTILLSSRAEELPNECECIIEQDEEYCGIYHTREGRENGTLISFDRVGEESLLRMSRTLGRIEVVENELDGEIPSTLSFFDMLGVGRPEELNAADRWKKSNIISSMRALVGFKNGNAPCYLDIHEKYHGPHGLVAGTTGSGKSETLQTYILSLALNFSPEDVGFFIIDYKGGGMANLFDGLPHLIGSISNLSGNQVQRAMVSIQSENRRRQRIFSEYGVNNINGYTALYKNGDASEPIPHLLIIIDEFAELKREEPEFMKELISVAQVGRSLGVHLILSTQRPSGTVDENIWANSKFRLCLRVQDRQDSMDMLHRPEAAYLTQAGRCYLQVGNDEIFELFQSGWSGASYDEELGGGSLLIAQMLSSTGKVDLAGNHAKVKRREELKRAWIGELIGIADQSGKETGLSVLDPDFDFMDHPDFRNVFYQHIHEKHPDFEENQFNSARIDEFLTLYRELSIEGASNLPDMIARTSAREGRRLPEIKGRTQLEVVVDYLRDTAEKAGVAKMRKLWLPVLPEHLYFDTMEEFCRMAFNGSEWKEKPRGFRLNAVIGMADDPSNQTQMPVSLDFAEGGHHLLVGTVSTGKSTFLQSAVYSFVSCYTPDVLNVYCLDFSAKMLSVFAGLKAVGGYMDESDLENDRISKFFTMMEKILDERKKKYAGTSFGDYVNHKGWTDPAVLLVIDSYGNFHEKTGEAYEAIMSRIIKEGNGYGIYLLVSAGGIGLSEMPGRLAENFRTSIALEMQDIFAYGDVLHVVKPPVLPESRVKGRGLIYYGDRILEFQTALAAHSEGAPERNDLIRAEVERMNTAWNGLPARSIPFIPEKPKREDLTALPAFQSALSDPALLPIGWDYELAEVWSFDLLKEYIFLVTGTNRSGKSVLMENMMLTAMERGDEILIMEPSGDRFAAFAERTGTRRAADGESILEVLTHVQEEMIARAPVKKACIDAHASDEELFEKALGNRRIDIFIGSMDSFIRELHDTASPAKNAEALFETLCERGRGYNIFVFGEVTDPEQKELMGYHAFELMAGYRSGIRFGGRLNAQKIFPFDNVSYMEQDRSMKPGEGLIPSDNRDERITKVVVPML